MMVCIPFPFPGITGSKEVMRFVESFRVGVLGRMVHGECFRVINTFLYLYFSFNVSV